MPVNVFRGVELAVHRGPSKFDDESMVSYEFPTYVTERLLTEEVKIKGVLAPPQFSLNGHLYLPEELKRGDGKMVPLYWEHDYTKPIGTARLYWNGDRFQLEYEAEVSDEEKTRLIRSGDVSHVSLGAYPSWFDRYRGYDIPRGLDFYEASLTQTPGIPQSTIRVIEHNLSAQTQLAPTGRGAAPQPTVTEGIGVNKMSEQKTDEEKGQSASTGLTARELADILDRQSQALVTTFREVVQWLGGREKAEQKAKVSAIEETPGGGKPREPWEEDAERYRKIIKALMAEAGVAKPIGIRYTVPILYPPSSVNERVKWLQNYEPTVRRVTEAIGTGTTGVALGLAEEPPIRIVPNNLIAQLRDTVNFVTIPNGAKDARFGTLTVPAAGSLTENTEPTEVSPTLTTVDATPSLRGIQLSVSYELEQKAVGSMIQAVTESFRLSELEDEDGLILTEATDTTPAATLYGDESVSAESSVTSTMTFSHKRIASAIREVTKKGYDPTDLVAVLHPVQFDAIAKESDIYRDIQMFSADVIRQGIIPTLYGAEVRRSTKVTTGTGSGGITTYRASVYKKGVTFGLAASRDILIETFKDIRKNQTVIKGSWDMACKAVQPNSLVKIITA